MCTVTFIPATNGNGFILTSNRDERVYRPCSPPEIYEEKGMLTAYPKDAKAGGSWIAANNKGRICCLLNGAFEPHQKEAHHTSSRGKVLTKLTTSEKTASSLFEEMDLSHVEPFTIITLDQTSDEISCFNEIIWDGKQKHIRKLNEKQTYIWSSVTLYNREQRDIRRNWFSKFLQNNAGHINNGNVISFHSGKHIADEAVNIVMEREGGLKTVSITQVYPEKGKISMKYLDLISGTNHSLEI